MPCLSEKGSAYMVGWGDGAYARPARPEILKNHEALTEVYNEGYRSGVVARGFSKLYATKGYGLGRDGDKLDLSADDR